MKNIINFIKAPYLLYLILKAMFIYKTSSERKRKIFDDWYFNSEIKKNVRKRKIENGKS